MNPELRQSSMSLSKSFTRYLSPQTTEKTTNQGFSNVAYPSARETIGLTQSAILSKNEHVIPLDLQYTVTKKVEVSNYSDYEVRIQTLQHESELWRKRYLEMMAKSDKNIANLEIVIFVINTKIALQEQRIQLLLRENAELNGKLKAALTENEQLRLEQYNIELQYSINRENSGQELSEQLNRRNNEIRDWKEKYTSIESQLTQYQTLAIDLGEAQTKNKILQLSVEQWQSDYWKLVDERKKYLSQEVPEENTEQLRQLLTELKVKESDLNNLSHKIRVLEREIENIKKLNLQQETEILDLEGVLSAEKLKNSKLNEQIIKFQISIQNKQNEINNLDNEILRLHGLDEEVENLDREIKDLQSIINTKDDDNNKLRREISRLETTNQELKHEKLQKSQVEIEFKQQQEQLQNLFNLYNEKKNSFDQLKIKYGSLEIDNSQYKARIEELKYEQIQLLQLESENKNLLNRIQYLESTQKQLQQEVLELSTKLQEIKILEIDNKTQQELIQLKDIEIAQLRKRVTQYEIQPKNDTNELERQLRLLQQIIDKLQNEIKVKQAEIDRYFQLNQKLQYQITQNEIGQEFNFESKQSDQWQPGAQEQQIEVLQHTNAELESNIAFLTSQISNLQKQILSRKQEVEDWRRQAGQNYVEATESKRIISELQTIGQQLQNENQSLLKQVDDLDSKSKAASLKQQQSALQLNQEQLKLNGQINQLKQDLQKTQIELKFSKKDSEKNKENYLRAEQQNLELRQLEEKYNYQVQKSDLLSQDNQRLNQLLKETPTGKGDAEFNDENQIKLIKLQERNDKLTSENVEISSQIRILEQKLADKDFAPLELKIQILQKENQRVDLAYRNKLRDAEELRNRCNALDQTVIDLKYLEKRVPDLSSRIQSLEIGLRDAQQALSLSNSEQEKLNLRIVKQELQLKEYGFLQREHAALQSQYKQNQQETQQLRTKVYLQEQEIENYQVQSGDLTKKYQQLTNDFKNQKDALAERNRDAEKLLIRLQKAELAETKLLGLQQKIKALELQSAKQAIEITEQQHIAQTAKNQQIQAQQLNDKLNFDNLQLLPYRNKVNELQFILKRDQELIQQTNIEIAQLKKDRDTIQQQSQQQINQLTQKNDQLTEENKQVRDLQQLVNQDNEQINDLIKQNNQLQQEIFAVRLQNNSLVERIRKYEVIEQDFQKLKEINDRYSEQLRQLKAQVQQLESDKSNFLNIKNSLESRVAMLASEIERQSYKVNVKNNELEKTQEQLKGLQQALQESQQYEGEFRSADDAVIKLRQELEQLKSQIVRQQKDYDEIKQQKDILEGKTQNSQGEYDQIRSRLQRSEQEKEQLILDIQKLQNEQINRSTSNELQANVNTQIQLNEQLQQQLQVKNQELIKIKQGISDLESDIQQLRQTQLDGQKLQIQIMTFNKEKEEWHQKLDQLQRSIENLEKQKLELQGMRAILIAENDSAKQKLSIAIQEKRLQQDQVNNFKDETDRLNQQLQDAYQEIEELRKRQSMLQGSFMGGQLTNSMVRQSL
ncbi:hypothetical protein pb186bvf_005025 [Paramecium bursaria]